TTAGADAAIAQVINPVTGTQQGTPVTATSGTNSVLSSLNSIPALNGNVSVTGPNGGPFTISIKNLGNARTIDVSGTSGGRTAMFPTSGDGVAGSTSDLDQLTAVTSHELAEAVTDPNVNYKTLGWYDTVNNVEIADLPNAAADIPNITVRLNG